MVTKSQAIKAFLERMTHPDLAEVYSLEMECQVNAAKDDGRPVEGEFKGKHWRGWTDGLTTWKTFRIPFKADSAPEFKDGPMKWDLAQHAEGIGMTGWNWVKRKSYWVGYDFDAIAGHSEMHTSKLTKAELDEVAEQAQKITWVTVRKSTSGRGLHLYVKLDGVDTANHNEHAALARSILGKMSALAGYNFGSKMDVCGGNMWVWHRKMINTDGLTLLKQGETLRDLPLNWRDHIKVVKGKRTRNIPESMQDVDSMEQLSNQRPNIPLEPEHRMLIKYLDKVKATWWWDADHNMLVAHTKDLEEAHTELQLRGYFKTESSGQDRGEQNCFAFPCRGGGWAVRRYSKGVNEHSSWDQDSGGWRRTYLNCFPDLGSACRSFDGVEDDRGAFQFREAEMAASAALLLGVSWDPPPALRTRPTQLSLHKDGRLMIRVKWDIHDSRDGMAGWHTDNKKKQWMRLFNATVGVQVESETEDFDNFIRHMVDACDTDSGWAIFNQGTWRNEPLVHVKLLLASNGYANKEVTGTVGQCIAKAWKLVNKPFQPEYPGNREWNRYAAQFRFHPSDSSGNYDTWLKVLKHCGSGLTRAIQNNDWCKSNAVLTGTDYLKIWIASLFQVPSEPLPYLFLYGQQNSGKSILHECISLLLTKGYSRADSALTSSSGFNAEIEHSVLCVVEETDLNRNKAAYNKIKDWVTSRQLLIHQKGKTPHLIPNTTHWMHCANEHTACPVFPGDTRITMCYVEPLKEIVPKRELIDKLESEAPAFLHAVLNLELPRSKDRLNVPVIVTDDKKILETLNQTLLERFLATSIVDAPGRRIKFSDLFARFTMSMSREDKLEWSKVRVGRDIPPHFCKGRDRGTNQVYVGNVWWAGEELPEPTCTRYFLREDFMYKETDNA